MLTTVTAHAIALPASQDISVLLPESTKVTPATKVPKFTKNGAAEIKRKECVPVTVQSTSPSSTVRIRDMTAAAAKSNHIPVIALASGSCDYVKLNSAYKTYGDVPTPPRGPARLGPARPIDRPSASREKSAGTRARGSRVPGGVDGSRAGVGDGSMYLSGQQ